MFMLLWVLSIYFPFRLASGVRLWLQPDENICSNDDNDKDNKPGQI